MWILLEHAQFSKKYVRLASQTVSFTCNKYAQEAKYDRYENRVKSEGHLYLPIVFEYYGGMSDDAVDLNAAKCEYENK